MNYKLYGSGDKFVTHDELKAEQVREQMLLARAENSGSEGCYVEVAKWNEEKRRWERYAFEKFFGGEHPSEADAMKVSCFETADKFAAEINNAAHPDGFRARLIHIMPDCTQ